MPRIGCQIDHDDHVFCLGIEARFSTDGAHRYSLRVPFAGNDRDELVAVVLKNPSAADARGADTTIRRVATYVWRKFPRAHELVVLLNLFALRATDASDVAGHIAVHGPDSAVGQGNDVAIATNLKASDHIVAAWGNTSGIPKRCYEDRIHAVVAMLRPYAGRIHTVNDLPATGYPRHGLRWSYRHELRRLADLTELDGNRPA